MTLTAPRLMALARGLDEPGPYACFYCGAGCSPRYTTGDYVAKTFLDRAIVAAPQSGYVCAGCARCALDGPSKAENARRFSWVVTMHAATRYTARELELLRNACLEPPEPAYAIVLAVSAQKHLLYRAPVNRDRQRVRLLLETEPVTYQPAALAARLELCSRLVAATGKPALAGRWGWRQRLALEAHWGDQAAELFDRWIGVQGEPLTRLAALLVPIKEHCLAQFPPAAAAVADGAGVPAGDRRPARRRAGRADH